MTSAWPFPFWIAHRGAGRLAPENTMEALATGASHGFSAFEVDAKPSADGHCFLLHDDTLNRTTNGSGEARLPWSQLQGLDAGSWLDPKFASARLPRLREALAFCASHRMSLNVEIKPFPGFDREAGLLVMSEILNDPFHATGSLLLSSFSFSALEAARAVPGSHRFLWGVLCEEDPEHAFAFAQTIQAHALILWHPLVSKELIARGHQAGLRILTFTVNSVDEARRLQALGIDGIITDAINLLGPR